MIYVFHNYVYDILENLKIAIYTISIHAAVNKFKY